MTNLSVFESKDHEIRSATEVDGDSDMVSSIKWHLDRLGYTGYTVAEHNRSSRKVRITGNGLDCVRYDMDVLMALRHLSHDEIPPDLGMVLEHCLF